MGATEIIQTVITCPCYFRIQVHVHVGMSMVSNCKLSHSTNLFHPSNYAGKFVTQHLRGSSPLRRPIHPAAVSRSSPSL